MTFHRKVADFSDEYDRFIFHRYYLSFFMIKRLTLRMRNTCKMKTLDFYFSKTLKILSKIRSFLDKKWTSFTEETKSFG